MALGYEERRTIFALASGVGKAAIAIIRISGPSTARVIAAMVGRLPSSRKAALRQITDPSSGEIIDTGLVLWFPGPASFTGEDCAEFQVHGSRAVVALILRALGNFPDMRLAQPGEFARRALENGKLDLVSVEALGDLIDSETEQQRRLAIVQASGHLQEQVARWRTDLIDALVMIESELDFSDEADAPQASAAKVRAACKTILESLAPLATASIHAERLREGMTVLIAGPPNAGKSTLLNALARREAAIVSERAGTTRDLIVVKFDLGGYPVNLIDTAGIRESDDPIEQEGINRALKSAQTANLILWLAPQGRGDAAPPEEFENKTLWRLVTKADDVEPDAISWDNEIRKLAISAKTGRNLDELIKRLQFHASNEMFVAGSLVVANERQRTALRAAEDALLAALDEHAPPEIIAEELRRACFALESLIGKVGVEDVLDRLFARFCIGK